MRVLHVHSGNLYGGIETYLLTLARSRGLCSEMKPEFALCFTGRLRQELEAHGANVKRLGNVQTRYPWQVLRTRSALNCLLRDENYDVVMCHSAWAQAIFGPVVRGAGVPLVFFLHNVAGRHWLERWASRTRPDSAICNSRFTQSSLTKMYSGIPSDVLYLPVAPAPGVNLQERLAFRTELKTPTDTAVIIQVSRMEALKGHALHLEALAQLKQVPGWVAWIVGGAQRPAETIYMASLEESARCLGIADRVRFLGERCDVRRLLAAADIFCQPNLSPEPFGISFVEALYAGLPVVATALGGATEIVDNSCGLLVQPANTSALAEALQTLLVNADKRRTLARGGPARARDLCDPEKQMRALERILHLRRTENERGQL